MRGLFEGGRRGDHRRAAHTNALGPKGMAQKSSDFSAIPLAPLTTGKGRTLTIVSAKKDSNTHIRFI